MVVAGEHCRPPRVQPFSAGTAAGVGTCSTSGCSSRVRSGSSGLGIHISTHKSRTMATTVMFVAELEPEIISERTRKRWRGRGTRRAARPACGGGAQPVTLVRKLADERGVAGEVIAAFAGPVVTVDGPIDAPHSAGHCSRRCQCCTTAAGTRVLPAVGPDPAGRRNTPWTVPSTASGLGVAPATRSSVLSRAKASRGQ